MMQLENITSMMFGKLLKGEPAILRWVIGIPSTDSGTVIGLIYKELFYTTNIVLIIF
jgi:hypothetical protein